MDGSWDLVEHLKENQARYLEESDPHLRLCGSREGRPSRRPD